MTPILIIIPIFLAIITFIFYVQEYNSDSARRKREEKKKVAYFNQSDKKGRETEEDYTYHPNENI